MQQERFPQGLEADNSVRGEEREAKWVRQVRDARGVRETTRTREVRVSEESDAS